MGSTALRRPACAVAALVGILGARALVPGPRQQKKPPAPLTSTYAAIRAPFDTSRAANYAVCAKRAINDGALDKARKTYEYYVEAWAARDPVHDAANLILRWALLEQRAANATGARDVFKLGARLLNKNEDARARAAAATLFCSWGLAEYRHRDALGSPDRAKGRATALLTHASGLDASKAPVLKWKQFAAEAEPAVETPKKQVPPPRRSRLRDLPPKGAPDDPFRSNAWKRRILERYERMQDDLLDACARDDAAAVDAAARPLEGRNGKRWLARSKDLVGPWTARWAFGRTAARTPVVIRGPGGAAAVDAKAKDPVLDVGAAYACGAGELVPTADASLEFRGVADLPPAVRCTYLDERVFVARDAEGRPVVLARDD